MKKKLVWRILGGILLGALTVALAATAALRMRIAKENIVVALAVKFVILILGALGIADMWLAVFGDVGVLILAVLNATRALRKEKIQ